TLLVLLAMVAATNGYSQSKLQDGTQVDIITTEAVSSKTAKEGDQIVFQFADDIVVDGRIVLKGGSVVKGQITVASRAKMLGTAGKLDFILDYGKAVDGTNVRLRAAKSFKGKDKSVGVLAAGAFVFAPLLLIKGKEITIEKGQRFHVYVDRDYVIHATEDEMSMDRSTTTIPDKKIAEAGSMADEIKKLKALYDAGALSKDEFDAAKKKALARN
ncbi:MAG: hypothetical protein JWN76_1911, partial [Chitinophagaceae bacterium]|nr:hypothetical protein [Chitinophagaceae bacterium]